MSIFSKKERLEALINHFSDGKKGDFASMLGITAQAISTWLSRNTFDLDLVFTKCEGISPEWLLTGKGEMLKSDVTIIPAGPHRELSPGTKAVHLYDVSAAAGYGSFDEIISHEKIIDTFIVPTFKDISWMIFVRGSSMYPKYSSGDIIACRILYESQFIQWGKVYVVATREQGLLVKRLKESKKKNCIKVISDNPAYDSFDIPKDEILGIALVVGVIRVE